jgi:multicomponent K+:H+ antiporter subunit G
VGEIVASVLIIIGVFFSLVGSIGLVKLPDFFTRLHGPTKATTLGVGSMLIASSIYFYTQTDTISLHEILITLFLFLTAPISAHIMSKAAIHIEEKKEEQ